MYHLITLFVMPRSDDFNETNMNALLPPSVCLSPIYRSALW